MALPELVAFRCNKLLDAYYKQKFPPHMRDQIRLFHEVHENLLTVFESRAPWDGSDRPWSKKPVAQFSFDPKTGDWELHCFDRHSKPQRFHPATPTRNFEALLDEVKRDSTGIFWG